MPIFSKPVADLQLADLQELLADKAVETLVLEFKQAIPDKAETVKKLSSFANTLGGLVVVGASATKDGRINGLPGVEAQAGYKQTVVQWCFAELLPPLDVDVSDPIPLDGETGRVCYVIGVRESDVAPHFLNKRNGVYVRTNEFSSRFEPQLANDNELRHLFQRRELVRARRTALVARARKRYETFIEHHELGRKGRSTGDGAGTSFELSIGPRFPAAALCTHDRLLRIVSDNQIPWRQVGFPYQRDGMVTQHESVIAINPAGATGVSLLEATVWGMLFYAAQVELALKDIGLEGTAIHSNMFVGHLLVFLRHASVILRSLGYDGPLRVEVALTGIRGKQWSVFENGLHRTTGASEFDDALAFTLETNVEELTSGQDVIATNILRDIFYSANLQSLARPDGLRTYLNWGHIYNLWKPVPPLY